MNIIGPKRENVAEIFCGAGLFGPAAHGNENHREEREDGREEGQLELDRISSRLSSRPSLISCNFLFLRQDFHFSCAGCANEFFAFVFASFASSRL
ncbi:MAG: hypothetical protein ABSB74_19130, partial [Tepidisphaeraceae bacterium]